MLVAELHLFLEAIREADAGLSRDLLNLREENGYQCIPAYVAEFFAIVSDDGCRKLYLDAYIRCWCSDTKNGDPRLSPSGLIAPRIRIHCESEVASLTLVTVLYRAHRKQASARCPRNWSPVCQQEKDLMRMKQTFPARRDRRRLYGVPPREQTVEDLLLSLAPFQRFRRGNSVGL